MGRFSLNGNADAIHPASAAAGRSGRAAGSWAIDYIVPEGLSPKALTIRRLHLGPENVHDIGALALPAPGSCENVLHQQVAKPGLF
jgi:hypothetical protein